MVTKCIMVAGLVGTCLLATMSAGTDPCDELHGCEFMELDCLACGEPGILQCGLRSQAEWDTFSTMITQLADSKRGWRSVSRLSVTP
ncbi:MAG: hypothetical protein AMXMBFR84_40390 [Candidatus Hydrogenedentota bacterium]